MKESTKFNTYNQITKVFDVMDISVKDLKTNKSLEGKRCLLLLDKQKGPGVPPDPKITLKQVYEILMKHDQILIQVVKNQQQDHEVLMQVVKNQQQDHEILMKLVKRVDRIEDILERNNLH